jgi:16S rRNA (uracil1498-N3)-methyltransferase
MTRIFLPPEKLSSQQLIITGDQARHLTLVMRVKPGDTIFVLDGTGYNYECRILSVHKKEIQAEIIHKKPYTAESPVSITLAQGIPKGEKMDFIIQKTTELGIKKVVPLITELSQVRHTEKVERWRKIAFSASQQSGRDKIPSIGEPIDFNKFLLSLRGLPQPLQTKQSHFGIIFSEDEKEQNLKKILNELKGTPDITLLVGPEGGFSKDELHGAIRKGFISASLGPRILRTETAPLTALSIIQYELGDIG